MCPACREPLVAFELEGVEIDRCVVCGGTWLDAGELEQIGALAGVAPGVLSAAVEAGGAGRRGRRRCPRCGVRLRLVRAGQALVVEVDRCPRGHGLWFDQRELERLTRSLAGDGQQRALGAFFGDLYRHQLGAQAEGG